MEWKKDRTRINTIWCQEHQDKKTSMYLLDDAQNFGYIFTQTHSAITADDVHITTYTHTLQTGDRKSVV